MIEANVYMCIQLIISIGASFLAIVFCVAAILSKIDGNKKEEDILNIWTIRCMVVGIVGMILLPVGSYKCEKAAWNYSDVPYSTEHITSLNDSNMVNGKFYLRHGYIEENLYYQYMVKLNKGGFIANKVKADNAMLYYSDDNFRVEWYAKERHWLWFQQKETYNKIYIPEGSISEEYSIDLK